MGYYIDLKSITIDNYKKILKTMEFIPSWMILKENSDKNMDILKNNNIQNLDELLTALKDKSKIQIFSKQSGIAENYLTVLKRVAAGYLPKPNKIKDFSCVSKDIAAKLEAIGIKNTYQLYEEIRTKNKRTGLTEKTGISLPDIMKLTRLTDLSRIRWVNHTFAYVLLEAGFDTAEKVAHTEYQKLYDSVNELNSRRKIYNAQIGIRDMKMVIEAANVLDFEIEY